MRETSCCLFQKITNLILLYFSVSAWPIEIFNNFSDSMVNNTKTSELQLNKVNVSDTEA